MTENKQITIYELLPLLKPGRVPLSQLKRTNAHTEEQK